MELAEMLAVMAAPIYAARLHDYMQRHLNVTPSAEWTQLAIALAISDARLIWQEALKGARGG